MTISAAQALERLRAGNLRFVASVNRGAQTLLTTLPVALTGEQQQPFAIVLGCSDSRVPAEIIFNQGLGELFVIRVAGNIVAPSQVGSVEFAASRYATRLVVVLGHSQCGAVLATIDSLRQAAAVESRNVGSIVARIRPSVEPLMSTELRHDPDALTRAAVRSNVRVSVDHLRHGSAVLERLSTEGGLMIVGAEYSLETGIVDFFDSQD
jgi:carbonic anhydrase